MKHTANLISVLRILVSQLLLVVVPLSPMFFAIYLLCGLTDVLDGFIARKTHTETILGAKLDTVGDIVFTAILIIFIFGIINLTSVMIIWFIAISVVKILSIIVGYIKYKFFSPLHTYLNKITGVMLFLLPVMITFIPKSAGIYTILTFASISAVDELLIIVFKKSYNANQKFFIDSAN